MLKVGSAFSGVGMWELGLKYLKIEHEVMFMCENDKFPIKSYKAIHGNVKNYGDITKVNGKEVSDIDLFVYSPPCQAFSVAGKGLGVEDPRGVLFFDAARIIKYKQPKIAIMENVKGLTYKNHKNTFAGILQTLRDLGYKNYWKILNTKDYGVPQNRERVFIVSIRKDINKGFSWTKLFDNGVRLKDVLEKEVNNKYYIDNEKSRQLLEQLNFEEIKVKEATKKGYTIATEGDSIDLAFPDSKTRRGRVGKGVAQTLDTSCNQAVVRLGGLYDDKDRKRQARSVYDKNGICATLGTMQSGYREPIICEQRSDEGLRFFKNNICGSLRTIDSGGDKRVLDKSDYTIRKLTPKECWRLQGIKDSDFEKAEEVNSNSQLYKQAGNGVSVNVVMEIYKALIEWGYIAGSVDVELQKMQKRLF